MIYDCVLALGIDPNFVVVICDPFYLKSGRKPTGHFSQSLVENERLVTKKMTKICISMTTFGLAITGG